MNEAICNRKSLARPLVIRDCGLTPYGEALALQLDLCAKRQENAIDNTVLLVEHPAVITLGARKSENKLLQSPEYLIRHGIDVVDVRRGGGSTAHNPGQIVAYPIIKLKSLALDINSYVRQLEAIGIDLLARFGIAAARRKGYPGLWIGGKKIGAIGVQLKKWVTLHGMAININNDLGIFDNIVPCGIEGVRITSVKNETGTTESIAGVKQRLTELFVKYFSSEKLATYEGKA
jgi:lipoate-protein ligase B